MIPLIALAGLARSKAKGIEAQKTLDMKLDFEKSLGEIRSEQAVDQARLMIPVQVEQAKQIGETQSQIQLDFIEDEEKLKQELWKGSADFRAKKHAESMDHLGDELEIRAAQDMLTHKQKALFDNTALVDLQISAYNRKEIAKRSVDIDTLMAKNEAMHQQRVKHEIDFLEQLSPIQTGLYIQSELEKIKGLTGAKVIQERTILSALGPTKLYLKLQELKATHKAQTKLDIDSMAELSLAKRKEYVLDRLAELDPRITQKEMQKQFTKWRWEHPKQIAMKLAEMRAIFGTTYKQEKSLAEMKHAIENSESIPVPDHSFTIPVGDEDAAYLGETSEKDVSLYKPFSPVFTALGKKPIIIATDGMNHITGLLDDNTFANVIASNDPDKIATITGNLRSHLEAYIEASVGTQIEQGASTSEVTIPPLTARFPSLAKHPVAMEIARQAEARLFDDNALREVLQQAGVPINLDKNEQIVTATPFQDALSGESAIRVTMETGDNFTVDQRKMFYRLNDWRIKSGFTNIEASIGGQQALRYMDERYLDFYSFLENKEWAEQRGLKPAILIDEKGGGFLPRIDQLHKGPNGFAVADLSQKEINLIHEAGQAAGFNTVNDYIEALSIGVNTKHKMFMGAEKLDARLKKLGYETKDVQAKNEASIMLQRTLRLFLSTMTEDQLQKFAYTDENRGLINKIKPLPYATDLTSGPLELLAMVTEIIPSNVRTIMTDQLGIEFNDDGTLTNPTEDSERQLFQGLYQATYGEGGMARWANYDANSKEAKEEFAQRKLKDPVGMQKYKTVKDWLEGEKAASSRLQDQYSAAMIAYEKSGLQNPKARIKARRNMLKFVIAYQYASLLQGGTGGRTISDQDVENMLTALSQENWLTDPESMIESSLEIYKQASFQGQLSSALLSNDPSMASSGAFFGKKLAAGVDFIYDFNKLDAWKSTGNTVPLKDLEASETGIYIQGQRYTPTEKGIQADILQETQGGKTIVIPPKQFTIGKSKLKNRKDIKYDNLFLEDYIDTDDFKNANDEDIVNTFGMNKQYLKRLLKERGGSVPFVQFENNKIKFIMADS